MAYLYAWTTASPVLTDLVHDGAQEIREGVKAALNERIQSIVANIDNDPWQLKNIQAAVNNTYDIGTITSRFKAGYVNALAVNIGVVPSAGNILLANTGVVQSRNAAGLGNLNMLSMNASDVLQLYNGAATLTSVGVMTATTFVGNLTGNADTATTVSGNAATATKLLTARTINGVSFDGTANITVSAATVGTLTFGTHLTSGAASFSGANATISSDATNLNTVSTIVARDGSGNFSAGTITASLTGNVTGNVTGTAATVTGATQTSITTCANLTTIGTLVAGAVPASLVTAGSFGSGAFVFAGAVSGITTLAGTGAVSGFTSISMNGALSGVSTLGVAGLITSTLGANTTLFTNISGGTGYQLITLTNTGGDVRFAINGSTAAAVIAGGTAYAAIVATANATGIDFGTNSARRGGFSAAGVFDVNNGLTVSAGTTAVQALTATSGTFSVGSALPITLNRTEVGAALMGMIVIERASTVKGYLGLSAGDLISFIDSSATFNNFTISDAGAGTFRAGISCTTGTFSGDSSVAATKKLYMDGGGDTYIQEDSANNLRFIVGNVQLLTINSASNYTSVGGNFIVSATNKLYVDGGGDTYIVESAANQLDIIVNSRQVFRANTADIFLDLFSTATAANINYNGATGAIRVVSSSARFKTGITNLSVSDASRLILHSRPVSFRSAITGDDSSVEHLGFIAEEIDILDTRLCVYHDDKVQGLQYDRFIVPAVVVLQDHERRLQQLEHATLA